MCRARRPPCKDGSASPGTAGFLPMLGGPAGDRVVDYNAAAFSHLRREIRRSSRAIPACKAGQDLQDVMSNPLHHPPQLTAALHSTVGFLGIWGASWDFLAEHPLFPGFCGMLHGAVGCLTCALLLGCGVALRVGLHSWGSDFKIGERSPCWLVVILVVVSGSWSLP